MGLVSIDPGAALDHDDGQRCCLRFGRPGLEPGLSPDEFLFWSVAPPDHGAEIVPNVGVLAQEVGELDAAGYLEVSIDTGPAFLDGFELVDQGIIEGANGQTLATMEYSDHELHYVGFFAVGTARLP